MKSHKILSLIICSVLFLSMFTGCGSSAAEYSCSFFAMDTFMKVTVYGNGQVLEDAKSLVLNLESMLSVTNPASDISKLNLNKEASVSEETAELLLSALEICSETDGALDISIYPVITAWGFTTDTKQVPAVETLNALLPNIDHSRISVDKASNTVSIPDSMSVDLGSVSKGYASDLLAELFRKAGIKSALINLGGNVQVIGKKPDNTLWRIAITDPADTSCIVGYVSVSDKAVITSGSYQRFFEEAGKRYHHIIDPSTGYPADNGLSSVTVIGDSGLTCDALSTALFVMGLEDGTRYWKNHNDFDVIFIDTDNHIFVTEGIASVFTSAGGYEMTVINR